MSTTTNRLPAAAPESLRGVRALVIDIVGVCNDRRVFLVKSLLKHIPASALTNSTFTEEQKRTGSWAAVSLPHARDVLYKCIAEQTASGGLVSKETYVKAVKQVAIDYNVENGDWLESVTTDLYAGLGETAYADSAPGLKALKSKFFLVGFSTASSELTTNAVQKNGYSFDTVVCLDAVNESEPNHPVYATILKALQAESTPEEVAMVAIHPYDLESAKKHGLKTIFVARADEDKDADFSKNGFDLVIKDGGLVELGKSLGCEV